MDCIFRPFHRANPNIIPTKSMIAAMIRGSHRLDHTGWRYLLATHPNDRIRKEAPEMRTAKDLGPMARLDHREAGVPVLSAPHHDQYACRVIRTISG